MSDDPTPTGPLPDDEDATVRSLRRAMAARADAATPGDRLAQIHHRAHARRRATRAWTAVAAAAAVVVVGGGTALALTRPGPGDTVRLTAASAAPSPAASTTPPPPTAPAPAPSTAVPAPAATRTAAATTPAPATSPVSSPAATSALPSGAATVPVYFLGEGTTKLFREFARAGGTGDDATRALRAMLAGAAQDPDYTSPWSADDAARVTAQDGVLVVDLDGSAAATPLSSARAAAAVQQLVYTVTAAAGDDLPVEIRVGAAAQPTLFGHAVARTVSRAPQADVQAPAWITSTSTATPGRVVVEGVGTGFEGTLLYTVTDASGAEVARDAVQAGAGGRFAEFSVTVPLPAGTYTVAVQAPDESGGEAAAPVPDTKTVTVR